MAVCVQKARLCARLAHTHLIMIVIVYINLNRLPYLPILERDDLILQTIIICRANRLAVLGRDDTADLALRAVLTLKDERRNALGLGYDNLVVL